MSRKYRSPEKRRRKHGAPGALPGTLTRDPSAQPTRIAVIAYGHDKVEERGLDRIEDLSALRREFPVVWVSVNGLGDIEAIAALGKQFGLHKLALEDVVNLGQRAKVEDYHKHLYIVAHMLHLAENFETEQVSIFLGQGFVITFQEHNDDCLKPVRDRIRGNLGRIRGLKADALAYSLLDSIIDFYFPVLDHFERLLDEIEDHMLSDNGVQRIQHLHEIRRGLRKVRRLTAPLAPVFDRLISEAKDPEGERMIEAETALFMRDARDHALRAVETIDALGHLASHLTDYHLSLLNHRMNEVIKLLTVVTAVFIPLTFVVGIYGMNFNTEVSPWNMPELNWKYGYPAVLAGMGAMALGMLRYFRRKGWI